MARIDWQSVAEFYTVTIQLPACPHCGEHRRDVVRSVRSEGDDSRTRFCVCRGCSAPFVEIAAHDDID